MQTVVRLPDVAVAPPHAQAAAFRVRAAHLLIGAIFALLVANLGRVPLLDTGVGKEAPLLLNDLIVLGLVGIGLVTALRLRRLRLDSVAGWALAFAAIGGFSAMISLVRFDLTISQLTVSLAYLGRWLAYFGLYLFVVNFLRRADVPAVWRALETVILVFAGFGILQSIFLPGFAQIIYPDAVVGVDWDAQGWRLVSTFLDPNYAGMFIVTALLVLMAQVAFGARVAVWKIALLGLALALTVSRSSFVALLVGGLVIGLVRGNSKRIWRIGLGGMAAGLLLLPVIVVQAAQFDRFTVGGSMAYRIVSWIQAIEVFLDNPVLGIGYNTFGYVADQYGRIYGGAAGFGLDGGLLFIAVTTGVVGLAAYCLMFRAALRRCPPIWKDPERPAAERGLVLGVTAASLALVVHSLFLNSLLYPFLMETFWILWGLVFLLTVPRADEMEAELPERVLTPTSG